MPTRRHCPGRWTEERYYNKDVNKKIGIWFIFVSIYLLFPQVIKANGCLKIAVPAYFYPPSSLSAADYWYKVINTLKPGEIAIYNPSNGPGTSKNSNYQNVINQAKAKGVIPMGYVYTSYGARSAAAVKSDIDTHYNWYGTTSIFLDEVSGSTSYISYYQDLYNYVKSRGGVLMINPGTIPAEGYVNVADHVVVFESAYSAYMSITFPDWISKYPADKFVHLVYKTPQASLSNVLTKARNSNAGTDGFRGGGR